MSQLMEIVPNGEHPAEEVIEAWPLEQGAAVLTEVRTFIARFVVVAKEYLDVLALWAAHSHVVGAADTSPRLLLKSPEKACGKSRVLEVLDLLVYNPLQVMNATVPAIFRTLKEEPTTILYDEVDSLFGKAAEQTQDLRALLNAGYRRGATVARVVGEGRKMRVEKFPVFAAVSLAAIGDLPDTVESRSITIPMRRRAPDENLEPFRLREAREAAAGLRARLRGWTQFEEQLYAARPAMPDGVTDRAADCWEPLLAIADLAGGDWPDRARAAAIAITGSQVADDVSTGVRLLRDIDAVIGPDKMTSAALVASLNALDESPWGGWHGGRGIEQRDLARRLKSFKIEPKVIKLADGSTARGYRRETFADAFARYLRNHVTDVTGETPIRIRVTHDTLVTHPVAATQPTWVDNEELFSPEAAGRPGEEDEGA